MGAIQFTDIKKYKDKYNLTTFFETGTYKGWGIETALSMGFQSAYSIDIDTKYHINACNQFINKNVTLFLGSSEFILNLLDLNMLPGNVFFWLDAHLPPSDRAYSEPFESNIVFPLNTELDILLNKRKNINNDVIIIDDLRLYEPGNYKNGSINMSHLFNTIDFDKLFSKTHDIIRSYDCEGFLILLPK